MPDILYAIVHNSIVVSFAIVAGWLMIKNIRWQMESEDTDADDKK